MNVKDELQKIFKDVFDDDSIVISDNTSSKDIEDWDSFAQMDLIVAIERQFKIKFDVKQINTLKNVGEMINLITQKIGQ